MQPEVILLVDDEPALRALLCEGLRDDGFIVETAPTADEACRLIRLGMTFDILLTDVRMPGHMDGLDLARYVSVHRPEVRIIVMSGFTSLTDFDRRLGTFLRKPFTSAKLVEMIQALSVRQ